MPAKKRKPKGRVHTWDPVVTRDFIGSPRSYEYAPEAMLDPDRVVRVWATVGLGDDTISSIRVDGKGLTTWKLPDKTKLVADPAVLVYGQRELLCFTVGDKVGIGTNNGISGLWMAPTPTKTRTFGPPFTIIPQTGGHSTYGIGQPALAARPGCPTLMLYTDTTDGRNKLRANHLEVSPTRQVRLGQEYAIPFDDDGASCSAWWDRDDTVLHVVIVGDRRTGIRSFRLQDGNVLASLGRYPGGFWTKIVVDTPGSIDGAGVLRARDNQPVLNLGLEVWQGRGDLSKPATWGLHRFSMRLP